jgi:hypothetical protein
MKMTWPPWKYGRFDTSIISAACKKVTWPPRKYGRFDTSIISAACKKVTWPPGKYGRFETSHHFFCVQEDDVASQEVQKVRDITSFLLHARS